MGIEAYIYLIIAIAGEVVGTSALKASYGMTKLWPALIVLVAYSSCFWSFSIALKELPVGVAYSIWCGLGILSIVIIGIYFFKEEFTLYHFLGTSLILSGVCILTLLTTSIKS
jgi:small multidrug resistance pump